MATEFEALLVVGSPSSPSAGDLLAKGWLEDLGYNVTLIGDDTTPTDNGEFVFISTTTTTYIAAPKYLNWSGPVFATEDQILDDLDWGDNASTYSGTQIDVVDTGHAISVAAGLSAGLNTIASTNFTIHTGQTPLGPGAVVIAERPSSATIVLFTYDTAAEMLDGRIALNRKAFFGGSYDSGAPPYNALGETLWKEIVQWLDPNPTAGEAPPGSGGGAGDEADRPDPHVPGKLVPITQVEREALINAEQRKTFLSRFEVLNGQNDRITDIVDTITDVEIVEDDDTGVHHSITFTTATELDWGRQRVRPWIMIIGGGFAEERPQGVFTLTAPDPDPSLTPTKFTVTGFDLLFLLNHPINQMISYPKGEPILNIVVQILAQHGFPGHRIDSSRGDQTLSEPRVWPVEEGFTALQVINELLAMVSYDNLDIGLEDGIPQAVPHLPASTRGTMWTYDTASSKGIIHTGTAVVKTDWSETPNYLVVYRTDIEFDIPPAINDGLAVFRNQSIGPSSIDARDGFILALVEGLEAASQDDLEDQGLRLFEDIKHSETLITWETELNHYHRYHDVMVFIDRKTSSAYRVQHISYTHNVTNRTTQHEAHVVPGGAL